MFQKTQRKPRTILRSVAIPPIAAAGLLLTLLIPSAAHAAEAKPKDGGFSQSSELTPEELAAVTEQQISAANSGTPKFSSADLLEKVRKQIEADYEAREKKRAEEAAARAKAEAEAKAKAEAEAKAEEERRAAEERRALELQAQGSSATGSTAPPAYTGGGSKEEWMRAAGIPESDWPYVDYIVSRESSWNPSATNASSGACGLVQALPCSKVGGAGGYDPVSALIWQKSYVEQRYGGYAGAVEFWKANHWY